MGLASQLLAGKGVVLTKLSCFSTVKVMVRLPLCLLVFGDGPLALALLFEWPCRQVARAHHRYPLVDRTEATAIVWNIIVMLSMRVLVSRQVPLRLQMSVSLPLRLYQLQYCCRYG
jgi:hypothetical protein